MILLTPAELANIGVREAAALLAEGQLHPGQAWVMVKGAGVYAKAMLRNGMRLEQWADAYAKLCVKCEKRFDRAVTINGKPATATYCGRLGREEFEGGKMVKCGCLTALTIEGVTHGAARTVVEGYHCPSGYW